VLLIERVDDAADFLALRGQTNANRATIDARASSTSFFRL
jgi:hypothetical protein